MEENAQAELCSKCGDNEVSHAGTPRWCRNCRTLHAKQTRSVRAGMDFGKGFAAGVLAMRDSMEGFFQKKGMGVYEGREVAQLIREAPTPRVD